jgi:hypothetical protein
VFFVVCVLVCLALAPTSPPEFKWVNYAMAGLAGFWAIVMAIESFRSRGPGERGAGL